MSKSIGANIGELLASVAPAEGLKLSGPVRLIGMKVLGAGAGKLTVSATKQQRGVILVGPARGVGLELAKVRAFDWALNPVGTDLQTAPAVVAAPVAHHREAAEEMALEAAQTAFALAQTVDDPQGLDEATDNVEAAQEAFARTQEEAPVQAGGNGITHPPSIVLAQQVLTVCEDPKCRVSGHLLVSDVHRWNKRLVHSHLRKIKTQAERAEVEKKFHNKFPCKCGKLRTSQQLVSRCLVATERYAKASPIFANYEDSGLDAFKAAAEGDAQLQLPRIWAVYRASKVPTDLPGWKADDTMAKRLEAAVREHRGSDGRLDPYTIRPWAMAVKATNYTGSLMTFLMDAPGSGGWVAGWVPEEALLENFAMGYKTRLLMPRRVVAEYSV